ncbi:MAG: DUF3486 family protein [Ruminococcus sp.]|nr:DUF3486 family protein [Ruminococcus sp.]
MNEIKIFNHEEFGEIRTIEIDGATWFCGLDVCKVLGYVRARDAIKQHCNPHGAVKYRLIDRLGREQKTIFINEPNLYRLIAHSKLEGAIRFENWIFEEVLPEIRRTGTYGGLSVEKVFSRELEEKIESIVTDVINKKLEEIMNRNVTDTVNTLIPGFSILYDKIDMLEKNTDIKKLVSIIENASAIIYGRNKSKIENLPQEVRNQVDEMIISGKYSCQKIADFITENADIEISYMTVNRYKKKYFIIK